MAEKPRQSSDAYAVCPYCGRQHGDCWEWVKEQDRLFTCNYCERDFIVWADVRVTYWTRAADDNPIEGRHG